MNDQIELCELANKELASIADGFEKFGSDDLSILTQEQIVSAAVIFMGSLMNDPLTMLNPFIIVKMKHALHMATIGTLDEMFNRAEQEMRDSGLPDELVAILIKRLREKSAK